MGKKLSLIDAIHSQRFSELELLIKQGADVNEREADTGRTPLMYASNAGEKHIAHLLIDKGADVNARTSLGWTPLMFASKNGNTDVVRLLVEKGADVNAKESKGSTPLISAAGGGHDRVCAVLLEAGADLNACELEIKATPLIAASVCGYHKVMELLLDKGAKVDFRSERGFTALLYSATAGAFPAVQLLVKRGAGVNLANELGETALMRASDRGFTDIVRFLLDSGADTEKKTQDNGYTALILASDKGHADIVRLLLANGADKSHHTLALKTAFDYARQKGFGEIEALLGKPERKIQEKINVNKTVARNPDADKALVAAIWNNDIEAVIKAIEDGAAINPETGDDIPIIIATHNGYTDIVRLLLVQGADVNAKDSVNLTSLAKACGGGFADIARLLIEHGAEVNNEVLIAASIHKRPDIMRLLQRAQMQAARPNLGEDKKASREGRLIMASSEGDLKAVVSLLAEGAEPDARDDDGGSPLLWASRKGHLEIAKRLLASGASVDPATAYGWTPLMEACLAGHLPIAEILIANGANVNAATSEGATPLIFAASEGFAEIVDLLLKKGADRFKTIREGMYEGMTSRKFAKDYGYASILALLSSGASRVVCPSCGKEQAGGKYCSSCGAQIES